MMIKFATDLCCGIAGPINSIWTCTPGNRASNSPKAASCRSSFSGPIEIQLKKTQIQKTANIILYSVEVIVFREVAAIKKEKPKK
jgi:hypothetical protein